MKNIQYSGKLVREIPNEACFNCTHYGCTDDIETIIHFCNSIEILLGLPNSNNSWDNFNNTKLYKFINSLDLEQTEDYNNFMYFLESTLNHNYFLECIDTKLLAIRLAEALKLSNANVIICKNGNNYELYPIDIEFLGEKLVVDVLSWLDEYPNTKKSFSKALKIKKSPDKYRNIIDELRLSIEFLFKQLFNNSKSLENQKNNIGDYLKENNISVEISNM